MVWKVWGKRSGERKVRNSTPCASTLDGFSFKRSRDTRRVHQAGSNKGESLKYSPITDTAALSAQRDTGTTAGTRGLLAASTRMGAEPQTPSGPSFPSIGKPLDLSRALHADQFRGRHSLTQARGTPLGSHSRRRGLSANGTHCASRNAGRPGTVSKTQD